MCARKKRVNVLCARQKRVNVLVCKTEESECVVCKTEKSECVERGPEARHTRAHNCIKRIAEADTGERVRESLFTSDPGSKVKGRAPETSAF